MVLVPRSERPIVVFMLGQGTQLDIGPELDIFLKFRVFWLNTALDKNTCPGLREMFLNIPRSADWLSMGWPHYAAKFQKRISLFD